MMLPQKAKASASVAKRTHPKIKVAFAHAAMMDLVIAGAAYNWWSKSSAKAYAPTDVNVLLSAVTAPLLSYSGYLGSKLVYDYGVGVDMRGSWARRKRSRVAKQCPWRENDKERSTLGRDVLLPPKSLRLGQMEDTVMFRANVVWQSLYSTQLGALGATVDLTSSRSPATP